VPVWHEEAQIAGLVSHLCEIDVDGAIEIIIVDGDPDASTLRALGADPPDNPMANVGAVAPRAFAAVVHDAPEADAPDILPAAAPVVRAAMPSGRVRGLVAPRGRAVQMNAGAAVCHADILVFLHADTRLPAHAVRVIRDVCVRAGAGAFSPRLDSSRAIYRVFSWFLRVYTRKTGLPWGDQAVFVRRTVWDRVGGFRALPLMEDVEFVRRLRRRGIALRVVASEVRTSVRRFEANGPIRQAVRNTALMVAWRAGISPRRLVRWYADAPRTRHNYPIGWSGVDPSDLRVDSVGLAQHREPS